MLSRQNAVRIIAGNWRGTRIPIPAGTMVRPTPDRVRETIFNWLNPNLDGARCLDLCAGTGALGLEALSRGARETWFLEKDPLLVRYLRQQIEDLDANAIVLCEDVINLLERPDAESFDIVFLDPPYHHPLEPLLERLSRWLAPRARVYIERPNLRGTSGELNRLATSLSGAEVLKESYAGTVLYGLFVLPK